MMRTIIPAFSVSEDGSDCHPPHDVRGYKLAFSATLAVTPKFKIQL